MRWWSGRVKVCISSILPGYTIIPLRFLRWARSFWTPEGPQLILEYQGLFKCSVNVSTLRHLVGNELSCLQGKTKKMKNAPSLFFISDLQYLLKKLSDLIACQTVFICWPLNVALRLRPCYRAEFWAVVNRTGALRWPQRWQSGPPRRSLPGWPPGSPLSPPCPPAGLGPTQQPGTHKRE